MAKAFGLKSDAFGLKITFLSMLFELRHVLRCMTNTDRGPAGQMKKLNFHIDLPKLLGAKLFVSMPLTYKDCACFSEEIWPVRSPQKLEFASNVDDRLLVVVLGVLKLIVCLAESW